MFLETTLDYNEDMRRAEKKGRAEGESMLQRLYEAMHKAGKSFESVLKETADSARLPGLYRHYGITVWSLCPVRLAPSVVCHVNFVKRR